MSRELIFSPATEDDLDEILAYIATDKPGAAKQFVTRLRGDCDFIAENPGVGEDCSDVRPKMRRFTSGGYLIFFRESKALVEIVRVIHGARDWTSMFSKK